MAVAVFAALLAAPGRAVADASIAVDVEAVAPVYWLNDTEWLIAVTNPGTEPLTSVVVDPVPGSVIDPTTLTGPVVAVGNADDVLDPGEQWSYIARGVHLPAGIGTVSVSATAPDTTQVTALDSQSPVPEDPIEVTFAADATAVVAGGTVTWDVSARNMTSTPLLVTTNPVGRILFPGATFPIPYEPFGEPLDKGADGNDMIDPGETWAWRYSAVVDIDMSYLETRMGVARPDFPLTAVGASGQSNPVSVTAAPPTTAPPPTTIPPTTAPPPTTIPPPTAIPPTTDPAPTTAPPPTDDLPATGAGDRLAVIALLALAVGATLLTIGRRRPASSP